MLIGGDILIHIVLFEPEIPQNTGNIIRTCVATGGVLHVIKPLGFSLDEKHLRRAGLDYIASSTIHIHENWDEFYSVCNGEIFFVSRYGKKTPDEFNYGEITEDIYFVFGKESTGIPKSIMEKKLENQMRIPMLPETRSLNLSNCVAIVLYECLRQKGYPQLSKEEVLKGKDYIGNE